jgi:hypothetical protein
VTAIKPIDDRAHWRLRLVSCILISPRTNKRGIQDNRRQIMFTSRKALTAAAAVSMGTLLIFNTGAQAFAATGGPRISISRLNERVGKLSELDGVAAGAKVTLHDDATATDRRFEGVYTYYPAGSRITMSDMYLRWRDGLVAVRMEKDPTDQNDELQKDVMRPMATYVEQIYGTGKNSDGDDVVAAVDERQVTKRLIQDPNDSRILRLPDNAWLLRDEGNGQYTVLVDAFVFAEGASPAKRNMTEASDKWVDDGAQPIGLKVE